MRYTLAEETDNSIKAITLSQLKDEFKKKMKNFVILANSDNENYKMLINIGAEVTIVDDQFNCCKENYNVLFLQYPFEYWDYIFCTSKIDMLDKFAYFLKEV